MSDYDSRISGDQGGGASRTIGRTYDASESSIVPVAADAVARLSSASHLVTTTGSDRSKITPRRFHQRRDPHLALLREPPPSGDAPVKRRARPLAE
jgi:hypothetical protein